jgi:hypothetical protein
MVVRSFANLLTGANSNVFRFLFLASQASDFGSIPIARSITHDDSIVLAPLNQLNTASELGVLVPCASVGRRRLKWTPPVIDHLNPFFLNFDREDIVSKETSVIRVLTSPNASERHLSEHATNQTYSSRSLTETKILVYLAMAK